MEELEKLLAEATTNELAAAFWAAVGISAILPFLPYGRNLLYPFALLGTWAHEGGHGLAAILVGGKFKSLEIYSNLGGVAYSSGVGKKAQAIVAAGGLLGPVVAGGTIIIFGARQETASWILVGLAIFILISVIFFIRNRFGFVAMTLLSAGLIAATIYTSEDIRIFLAQLIGIQFCVSSWNTLDYMFTKNFRRNGKVTNSDTQDIAEALILPYWFWGSVIALSSVIILIASYYIAWVR